MLYKGLKGKARIPTDDLIPKNRRCRNQHSLAFQIPSASKEAYKSSFFPQTIRDYNDLPPWFSDLLCWNVWWLCVQVRISCESQGLISLLAHPLVKYCPFGVSPVNHSDSDSEEQAGSKLKTYKVIIKRANNPSYADPLVTPCEENKIISYKPCKCAQTFGVLYLGHWQTVQSQMWRRSTRRPLCSLRENHQTTE